MISEQIERIMNIKDRIKSIIGVDNDVKIDELPYLVVPYMFNDDFEFYIEENGNRYYPSYEGYSIDVRKAGEMLSFNLVTGDGWYVDEQESKLYGAHLYSKSGKGSMQFKVDLPTVDVNTNYLIVIYSQGCPLNLRINQIK